MNTSDKHFCLLPFFHLNIDYDGRIKPCCKIQESSNMVSPDLQSAFHSDYYLNLRKSFLSGEKPEACTRCWKDEDGGVLSYRQKYNERYKSQAEELKNAPRLQSLDTAFGSFCNAKCVTCESVSSHLWTEEEELLNQVLAPEFRRTIKPLVNFQPQFTNETLRDLQVINLTQSEALVQKGFYEMIKSFETEDIDCSQKVIKLSTNGGARPNAHVLQFLKSFRTVDLQFSVDGTEKAFDYLRFPLKWDKVVENFNFWVQALSEHPDLHLRCRFTASALNLSQFHPTLTWWHNFTRGLTAKNYFNIGVVATPEYLSPGLLPDEELQKHSQIITAYLPHWLPKNNDSSERKNQLREQLQKFIQIIDQRRGEKRPASLFSPTSEPFEKISLDFSVVRT